MIKILLFSLVVIMFIQTIFIWKYYNETAKWNVWLREYYLDELNDMAIKTKELYILNTKLIKEIDEKLEKLK